MARFLTILLALLPTMACADSPGSAFLALRQAEAAYLHRLLAAIVALLPALPGAGPPNPSFSLINHADQDIQEVYVSRVVEKAATDDVLHKQYDQFVKDHPPKEEVKASHILVAKEEDAKAVIAELNKGADFATLAKERSTDPKQTTPRDGMTGRWAYGAKASRVLSATSASPSRYAASAIRNWVVNQLLE